MILYSVGKTTHKSAVSGTLFSCVVSLPTCSFGQICRHFPVSATCRRHSWLSRHHCRILSPVARRAVAIVVVVSCRHSRRCCHHCQLCRPQRRRHRCRCCRRHLSPSSSNFVTRSAVAIVVVVVVVTRRPTQKNVQNRVSRRPTPGASVVSANALQGQRSTPAWAGLMQGGKKPSSLMTAPSAASITHLRVATRDVQSGGRTLERHSCGNRATSKRCTQYKLVLTGNSMMMFFSSG